ncbi:MAG: UPF0179 family protein [Thermoplasmatales archaeon]|nr:MAG: UPF0179 family protein [Thermoplasmatales archaeon]
MALVTLIGERLADEDEEFIYLGPNNECKNCKLKTVCFNLKPTRQYKITKVREKQHNCSVHEGNVVIVEVSELPIVTSIDKKLSERTKITVDKKECKNIGCDYFDICTNKAVQEGKTYTVKKVYEKIECPEGYELYKIELTD